MPDWKRVKIDFRTVKLGDFIEPVKTTVGQIDDPAYKEVYGVTNTEGIVKTGKKASADISKYIIIDKNYFAYNPYRINVGSIGANFNGLKGCVSPAYVVFKTKEGLDPDFLWYYLKSDFGNHLINCYGNRGGVRNALRYNDLCKIDIPAISYEKQLEIIEKVDHYSQEKSKLEHELDNQQSLIKQLRQSILQEAVEGKLTSEWRKQHPELISGENHAARLLEKIKAEKMALTKHTKGAKRIKELPPISEDEKPFELPEGWVWTNLSTCSINKDEYRIPVTKSERERREKIYDYYGASGIIDKIDGYTHEGRHLLIGEDGANLIARTTPIALIADGKFWVNNHAHVLATVDAISLDYLKIHINAIDLKPYVTGGFQPKLSQNNLNRILIAFPPLAEQQAIVEKVDKLMAKIDALEEQVKARKVQAEQLMQAVLREAFNRDE